MSTRHPPPLKPEELATPDPREDKLPAWAQKRLTEGRRATKVAQDKLAEHLGTVEKTSIWYGDYDNRIYVPEHYGYQTVHFNPHNDDEFHHDIMVKYSRDRGVKGVEINGGDSLQIDLVTSNLCVVRTAR
jgi:hypothetical protein